MTRYGIELPYIPSDVELRLANRIIDGRMGRIAGREYQATARQFIYSTNSGPARVSLAVVQEMLELFS